MDIKLRVLKGHHIDREFTIPTPKCLVGRGDECQMRARSEAVSRRHCASHPETRRLRLDETTRSPLQDPTVPEQQHPPTTKKTRNHRHPGKLPRRSAPKPKSDSNFSTSLSSLPLSTRRISLGIKVALDRRRHICRQCQIWGVFPSRCRNEPATHGQQRSFKPCVGQAVSRSNSKVRQECAGCGHKRCATLACV